MKKPFLFSVLFFCLFSVNSVLAQTDIPSGAVLVATVNIENAKIVSQNDRDFKISFDISNSSGIQSQVRYSVKLTKVLDNVDYPIDEKIYSEVLSLGSNITINKNISYKLPSVLSRGTYRLWVSSSNNNGLPFGAAYVGNFDIEDDTASNMINIEIDSCYFIAPPDNSTSSISSIISVNEGELIKVKCKVNSSFNNQILVSPKFDIKGRSAFGEVIEVPYLASSKTELALNEGVNDITFELPTLSKPQKYYISLYLEGKNNILSNKIGINYILLGLSGSIENVVFDKPSYEADDIAKIKIFSKINSTKSTYSLSVILYDESGNTCSATTSKEISDGFLETFLDVKVLRQCLKPVANVWVSVVEGDEVFYLDNQNYNIELTKQDNGNGTQTLLLFLVSLVILILLTFIFINKKKSVIKVLIIFIIGLSLFGYSNNALAATYHYVIQTAYYFGSPVASEYNYYITLNKEVYSQGEDMTVTGTCTAYNNPKLVRYTYCDISGPGIDSHPGWKVSGYLSGTPRNFFIDQEMVPGTHNFQAYTYYKDRVYKTAGETNCWLGWEECTKDASGGALRRIDFTVKAAFPIGAIDYKLAGGIEGEGCYISGWACDPNKVTSPLPVTVGYVSSSVNPPSWIYCAMEGGTCHLETPGSIRYGVDTRWYYKYNVSGTISCNNATFGDPAFNVTKSCQILDDPWTYCADEGGVCDAGFTASDIAYGANPPLLVYKYGVKGDILCNKDTFGRDPAPGIAKKCYSMPSKLIAETSLQDAYMQETAIEEACGEGITKRFFVPIDPSFTELWDGLEHIVYARVLGVNDGGEADGKNSQFTSTLVCKPPMRVNIEANPGTVTSGGSSIISWDSTGADSCTVRNQNTGMLLLPEAVWTPRTIPEVINLRTLTYGNGIFVGLALDKVMTSSDGATWTVGNVPVSSRWTSITYGNGTFVAVSYDGHVMTSSNGTTWTARTSPVSSQWASVTYGNGTFVAIGYPDKVITSPDGITWTARTAAIPIKIDASIAYGNGTFVVVSVTTSGSVMTSPNGITWTARTNPKPSQVWFGVTYGNGTFVASSYLKEVMTSPDGITWTVRNTNSPMAFFAILYGNETFVGFNAIWNMSTSPDGITWTPRIASPRPAQGPTTVAYGNGIFVGTSANDGTVMTSPISGSTSGSVDSGPLTSNTTFTIDCYNDVNSVSNSTEVLVDEVTPFLNISASGEEGIVWNTEGFETGFCEVKLDDETLSTLLSGSIYDVVVGEKYILECTTPEGEIMSDEVIAVPLTSKTICTPSQNFVNRPTVWTVSNRSGEVIETTWGGKDISTTTKSGGSLTKIYTTVGEKTINAVSTIRRDDETTFTSTCSTSTIIRLDPGSNTEI